MAGMFAAPLNLNAFLLLGPKPEDSASARAALSAASPRATVRFLWSAWLGLFAPRGTPRDIMAKLNAATVI